MKRSPFDQRLRPLSEKLFGYAVALTRDREQAADLFQDCVVKAMSARDVPDNERAFRAWLFTVMRNLWIDTLRAHKRSAEAVSQIVEDNHHGMPMPFETVVINQLAVREAFACLSIQHRDVLALIDIAGFSYEETAETLAIPKGTVMSRVSRARQAMFALLSDDRISELPQRVKRPDHA